MDNGTKAEIRAEMAHHLERIASHASQLLAWWYDKDLPSDFLAEDEYPFAEDLEEFIAHVQASAERIRDVNAFLELEPVTITVGPREFAELTKLLERSPRALPRLRDLLAREGLEGYLG